MWKRSKIMTTFSQTLRTKCRHALLAGVAFSVLLTPLSSRAAEQEGTVVLFSLEDLQQAWSHPSHILSPSHWPVLSLLTWPEKSKTAEPVSPLEQHAHWGNGQGSE